jgi:hypothetical protein
VARIQRCCLSSSGRRGEFMSFENGDESQSMKEHRETVARLQRKFEKPNGTDRWKMLRWIRTGMLSSTVFEEWIYARPDFKDLRELPITFGKLQPSADCSFIMIPFSYDRKIDPQTQSKLEHVINERYCQTIRLLMARELNFKHAPSVRFRCVPRHTLSFDI